MSTLRTIIVLALAIGLWGCHACDTKPAKDPKVPAEAKTAIFAGGCFWCMQGPFDKTKGVVATRVGYIGGKERRPKYKAVAAGRTGHREAIKVWYLPSKVSYQKLLDIFWRNIDPTDAHGQFADRGHQYAPAIYVSTEAERTLAEASKGALAKSGRFDRPIVVPILTATRFWNAEGYHQFYYRKNPRRYRAYKWRSGRTPFLERIWSRR